jgi:N-acetyl-gamma-glutamyl-phosphate reductase
MMIQAGIVGGTGYVAGELIRILRFHPQVEINFVQSHSYAGKKVSAVHDDLFALQNMKFTDKVNSHADVVFLCLGHGNSTKFLQQHPFSSHTKIIDLSNDFRLKKDSRFQNRRFTYGLTEKNGAEISSAENIANPGCFATAIQLALLPLAASGSLKDEIHVHGITGATGAGRGLYETTQFNWRNNNISVYKAFAHQHLGEIGETLAEMSPGFDKTVNFIPVRGDFSRGIFISLYTNSLLNENELNRMYTDFYSGKPFTKISDENIHLKQVVNTNYCLLHVEKHHNKAFVTAAIDNLLKGAAGQAVENMNLMFGLPQETGLQFKANYY